MTIVCLHCDCATSFVLLSNIFFADKGFPYFLRKFTDKYPEVDNMDVKWVNVWKPFDRPVEQNPLCLLDASTLDENDIEMTRYAGNDKKNNANFGKAVTDRTARGGNNYISQVFHNPSQQMVYWSRMQPNEALLFVQMDTRYPAHARYCFHTSCDDPTADSDAPGRRSIELRVLCAFAKKTAKKPKAAL